MENRVSGVLKEWGGSQMQVRMEKESVHHWRGEYKSHLRNLKGEERNNEW